MAGHDAVVHFAAESHVDRSIVGPDDFVHTNCFGTNVVCDTARQLGIEPVPPHLHRRGVRLGRGGLVHRDRPARAPLAVLGVQGRLRPDRPVLPHDLRPAGGRHPLLQQLRALPVPREGHPAVRHQPARRRARSRSTATASTCATGCYVDDHCAARATWCCAQGAAGEIYNIGAGNETPNRELVDKLLALLGAGEELIELRRPTASATTGATRSTSPRSPRSAGAGSGRSTRPSRPPWPGTATTGGGGSRSGPDDAPLRGRD